MKNWTILVAATASVALIAGCGSSDQTASTTTGSTAAGGHLTVFAAASLKSTFTEIGDASATWNTVIAGLPTVTEVSRSAFFLGAAIALSSLVAACGDDAPRASARGLAGGGASVAFMGGTSTGWA